MLNMRHGTCSDYNQYCPNARRSQHRHVPLAAQSVGNLRGHNLFCHNTFDQFQSQQPAQTEQTPQSLLHRHRQYRHLSSRPRSQQFGRFDSVKPSTSSTCVSNAAYQPLLPAEEMQQQNQHHQEEGHQLTPITRQQHIYNNNFRSTYTCCSNSIASTNGESSSVAPTTAQPSALDYYQEHIYQFFYHRHRQVKKAGSVFSARSQHNIAPSLSQPNSLGIHLDSADAAAATFGSPPPPPGADCAGHSGNVLYLLLIFYFYLNLTANKSF